MKKDNKHNGRRAFYSGIVWVLTFLIQIFASKLFELDRLAEVVISIITIISFTVFVYFYIKAISSMDEVKQRIHFEAAVIGFSLGLLLLMALSLLTSVVELNYDDWSFRHLTLYFIIFYYLGMLISKRKYTS